MLVMQIHGYSAKQTFDHFLHSGNGFNFVATTRGYHNQPGQKE